jgi:hypothetical protein
MTTFATIMNKLRATDKYPMFIRHKNGDTLDNRIENLEYVHIREAFQHINDWKVDWICYITEEERTFIVDMLTPTPNVYHYMKWRAEKEDTPFELEPSFFKMWVHKGVRSMFGCNLTTDGRVTDDHKFPELFEEFKKL